MSTWCKSAVNRVSLSCLAACRTRSRPCGALSRPCVRSVRSCLAFPLVPALRSTGSAAGSPALFACFAATHGGVRLLTLVRHALRLFEPSACGPGRPEGLWSSARPPRFRRDPFVRDLAFDPGRATAPCMTAPHISPSTNCTGSAPATYKITWLNPTPHTIAVYASPLPSPAAAQHSLAGGRYPLPAPDFHRLDRASFAWRTQFLDMAGGRVLCLFHEPETPHAPFIRKPDVLHMGLPRRPSETRGPAGRRRRRVRCSRKGWIGARRIFRSHSFVSY